MVPVTARLVTLKVALPVLVKVTVWSALVVCVGWLAKTRPVEERPAVGALPVPVRPTLWGLPAALSLRVTAAVRVPLPVGVKVTLIVQLAPAATLAPHVLV